MRKKGVQELVVQQVVTVLDEAHEERIHNKALTENMEREIQQLRGRLKRPEMHARWPAGSPFFPVSVKRYEGTSVHDRGYTVELVETARQDGTVGLQPDSDYATVVIKNSFQEIGIRGTPQADLGSTVAKFRCTRADGRYIAFAQAVPANQDDLDYVRRGYFHVFRDEDGEGSFRVWTVLAPSSCRLCNSTLQRASRRIASRKRGRMSGTIGGEGAAPPRGATPPQQGPTRRSARQSSMAAPGEWGSPPKASGRERPSVPFRGDPAVVQIYHVFTGRGGALLIL
ncbi:uncharacterized protein LOC113216789 [Frankliniella occidentalis]|uniref:Uncharacterized protein LOC113216789 n=1 Tax=Frankliniella occidentalis TaxID=133901 RepID=A0A9C6X4L8_FRAOC|nr:uncharacterized protein LOC113216789 [Frankliniella occidentalis]